MRECPKCEPVLGPNFFTCKSHYCKNFAPPKSKPATRAKSDTIPSWTGGRIGYVCEACYFYQYHDRDVVAHGKHCDCGGKLYLAPELTLD
jgi:predicted CxxxxCH...CXXCH cytochrome family protein